MPTNFGRDLRGFSITTVDIEQGFALICHTTTCFDAFRCMNKGRAQYVTMIYG